MARTATYSWRPYGDGMDDPDCKMVAYYTDPEHTPPQWQETLIGLEKNDAIAVINSDRDEDEDNGNFTVHWTYPDKRIQQRTSKRTGNQWEVQLDQTGWPMMDPCSGYQDDGGPYPLPEPPDDPRNFKTTLHNATVEINFEKLQATITIKGNLPQA